MKNKESWKNKGFNSVIEYRGWLVFNNLVSSESSLDNNYYNDFDSEHLNSKENTNKEQ